MGCIPQLRRNLTFYSTIIMDFHAQTCAWLKLLINVIIFFSADREVQRILLELLNQMDGFDQTVNVKVGISLYTGCPQSQLVIHVTCYKLHEYTG